MDSTRAMFAYGKYFWLCENCVQLYTIQHWTEDGVELVPRYPPKALGREPMQTTDWILPGLGGNHNVSGQME